MGSISNSKDNVFLQDLGLSSGIGLFSGLLASRVFEPIPTKGGALAGTLFGVSTSIVRQAAGKEASNTRTLILTIASIAVTIFSLYALASPLHTHFKLAIPLNLTSLLSLAAANILGQAITFYLPTLFSSSSATATSPPSVPMPPHASTPRETPPTPLTPKSTEPTIPETTPTPLTPNPQTPKPTELTAPEKIRGLSKKELQEHYDYYQGHLEAFDTLSDQMQWEFAYQFQHIPLDPIKQGLSFSAENIQAWSREALDYFKAKEWSSYPLIQKSIEQRAFHLDLTPPPSISRDFSFPTDVNTLSDNQRRWCQMYLGQSRKKWEELPLDLQYDLIQFPEFSARTLSPKSIRDVRQVMDLPENLINVFYADFSLSNYSKEIGLAFIKRFAELELSLSPTLKQHLIHLSKIKQATAVALLRPHEVKLYATLFQLNRNSWNALPSDVQWAFIGNETHKWPPLRVPKTRSEVDALPDEALKYFYLHFHSVKLTPEITHQLLGRFYQKNYPLTSSIRNCFTSLLKTQYFSLNMADISPAHVQSLGHHQINYLQLIYQNSLPAWTKLSIGSQLALKIKYPNTFPDVSYPVSVEEVGALTPPQTRILHDSFDLEVFSATGPRWKISKLLSASPIDNQRPKFFTLKKEERLDILKTLAAKFFECQLPLSKELAKLLDSVNPPQTIEEIENFHNDSLITYKGYYQTHLNEWNALPLDFQWTFKRKDPESFPPLSIPTNEENFANSQIVLDKEMILYLFKHSAHFNATNWVQLPLTFQIGAKSVLRDANIVHDLPCHPMSAEDVDRLTPIMIQAYFENFNPNLFDAENQNGQSTFNALAKCLTRQQPTDLKKLFGLSNWKEKASSLNELELSWRFALFNAQRKLIGSVYWKELSCQTQMILQSRWQDLRLHLELPYSSPTKQELKDLGEECLARLHKQYIQDPSQETWISLSPNIQKTLNDEFTKLKLQTLTMHNQIKAMAITNELSKDEIKSYYTAFSNNRSLWNFFDIKEQRAFNAAFSVKRYTTFPLSSKTEKIIQLTSATYQRMVPFWNVRINKYQAIQVATALTGTTLLVSEVIGYTNLFNTTKQQLGF